MRFPAKNAYYNSHKLDAFLGVFCEDPIGKLKKRKKEKCIFFPFTARAFLSKLFRCDLLILEMFVS